MQHYLLSGLSRLTVVVAQLVAEILLVMRLVFNITFITLAVIDWVDMTRIPTESKVKLTAPFPLDQKRRIPFRLRTCPQQLKCFDSRAVAWTVKIPWGLTTVGT